MAFQRALPGQQRPQGAAIERVRAHEAATSIAFMGRRRRVYTRIVAISGAKPGDRVLDVGCSGGYLARLLAAAVGPDGQVTGVDPATAAINYARRRAPGNCSFIVGVAQQLDLPDESFDVVTSTLAVHHFPGALRAAAFGEMHRVTRPGGRLLVADFRPAGIMRGLHPMGNSMSNPGQLAALVTAAGFHIEASGDLPKLSYLQARR
jgi:ubiquinone/menaquinone biosynthesis C-methylase UbiE